MDLDLPGLSLRSHLLAQGYSDGELRRLRRAGSLTTLRRGAYVAADDLRLRDPAARHALLIAAEMPHMDPAAVVSHASAAVLHGLPVWGVPLDRMHITRSRRTGGRRGGVVHVHAAPLDRSEVVDVGGMSVTSPARTVVDLARTLPYEAGVAVADAALHHRLVTAAELEDAAARAAGWPGSPTARRVVAFADGRSESVGESRSRVALHRAGLPVPVLQWNVRSVAGLWLGRVDFFWPDLRTVGEFDGQVKYGRLLRPGQDPGDAVFEEKRREDTIRDEDLRVVRWVWDDLRTFAAVAQRLRRAYRPA